MPFATRSAQDGTAGHWKRLLVFAALVFGLTCIAAPAVAGGDASVASITAPSYVAIDASSGRIIVSHDEQVRRPIASLTKVMTGLIVIERGDLSARAVVTHQGEDVEDYREGLVAGARYRRSILLRSALMVSANDSATVLALDAGGGSLDRFYALMNAKARTIGMTRTMYASASGLDDVHNLSTALDQARLARFALQNRTFATIVRTVRFETRWAAPTYEKVWVNHNKMLTQAPGTYGVKTGWTTRAGGCLIIAQRRSGHAVIGVVLGSQDIWSDMTTLLDAAFAR